MNKSLIMDINTRIKDIKGSIKKVEPFMITLVQSAKRNSLWIDIVWEKT